MKSLVGYGALVLLSFSGDALSGCATHECTEIGCANGFSLTLRRSDGMAPTERVEVDYDDAHAVCPLVAVDGERYVTCDAAVSLELRDQVTCTETETDDAKTQTCTPTGDYELVLTVQGQPVSVRVTLNDGATITEEQTFAPSYRAVQPNGEDCDPICHQASNTWVLPD